MRIQSDPHPRRASLLAAIAVLSTTVFLPGASLAQSPSVAPDCGPVSQTGIYDGWPTPATYRWRTSLSRG